MASDGIPVSVPVTRPVHGSQAPTIGNGSRDRRQVPCRQNGHAAAAAAAASPAVRGKERAGFAGASLAQLNKYFRESGRPKPVSPGRLFRQASKSRRSIPIRAMSSASIPPREFPLAVS